MLKSLTLASVILAVAAGSAPASFVKAPAASGEVLIVPADHIILYEPDLYVGPRVRGGAASRYIYRRTIPRIYVRPEPYGWSEDLSASEVRSALRQQGYRNVEAVRRAGRFYKARVRDSRSNLVWVTVSAEDGRVVRSRVVERAVKGKARRVARAERKEEKAERKVEKAARKLARAPRVREEEAVAAPRPYQPPKRDVGRRSDDAAEELVRLAPGLPEAKPPVDIARSSSQDQSTSQGQSSSQGTSLSTETSGSDETYVAARVEAGIPREGQAAPDVTVAEPVVPAGEVVVEKKADAEPLDFERDLPAAETPPEPAREVAEAPAGEDLGEGDASEAGDEEPVEDPANEPDETAALPTAPVEPETEVAALTPAPQDEATQQELANGEVFEDTELTPDEPEDAQQAAIPAAPVETAALIPPELPRVKPKIVPAAVRRVGVDNETGGDVLLRRSPGPEAAVQDDGASARPAQTSIALTPPQPTKAADAAPAAETPAAAATLKTDPADVPVRNPLVVYE